MRKEYVLTDQEFEDLMQACKPVTYMIIGGIPPRSPQENANAAWQSLGMKHGFRWDTVRPVAGKSNKYFSAEPEGGGA